MTEFTLKEFPFSWNDNFSEVALEDFSMIQKDLQYCIAQSIGMALAKLEMIEKQELNANKWIPCSERLPEIYGNTSDTVLVCGSNGFQYMAFWCDDLQWRFCECGTAKEPVLWTEIIAWMPLPQPYKEGE